MSTQAPSLGRILTMVAFAMSCVGLLIFLWMSFGGAVPLRPEGYRLSAEFDEADGKVASYETQSAGD